MRSNWKTVALITMRQTIGSELTALLPAEPDPVRVREG